MLRKAVPHTGTAATLFVIRLVSISYATWASCAGITDDHRGRGVEEIFFSTCSGEGAFTPRRGGVAKGWQVRWERAHEWLRDGANDMDQRLRRGGDEVKGAADGACNHAEQAATRPRRRWWLEVRVLHEHLPPLLLLLLRRGRGRGLIVVHNEWRGQQRWWQRWRRRRSIITDGRCDRGGKVRDRGEGAVGDMLQERRRRRRDRRQTGAPVSCALEGCVSASLRPARTERTRTVGFPRSWSEPTSAGEEARASAA